MSSSLESAVPERLAAFLAGEISEDDFKTWLVASTWNADRKQSSPGVRFANEIKLAFAEHSGGYRSDDELRNELVKLLNRISREMVSAS